jgi:hypothetical protein
MLETTIPGPGKLNVKDTAVKNLAINLAINSTDYGESPILVAKSNHGGKHRF